MLAAALGAGAAADSNAGLAVVVSVLGAAAAGADSGLASGLASALGSAAGSTARTALWQDGARLDMFFCRHCSDASPPGGMLEQCAS